LGNFTIEGFDPGKICDHLFNKYKIYTTPIVHERFRGVRVTPHVYTRLDELDYFIDIVKTIATEGIPN